MGDGRRREERNGLDPQPTRYPARFSGVIDSVPASRGCACNFCEDPVGTVRERKSWPSNTPSSLTLSALSKWGGARTLRRLNGSPTQGLSNAMCNRETGKLKLPTPYPRRGNWKLCGRRTIRTFQVWPLSASRNRGHRGCSASCSSRNMHSVARTRR
jgi:hypothetical protein